LVPTDKDGVFIQPALVPGRYTYFARATSSTDPSDPTAPAAASRVPTLWALADLDVGGRDVSDFVLTLQAGVTVSGKLTVDADSPQPDWSQAQISLDPMGDGLRFGQPPVRVTADGMFALRGLVPGDYTVSVTGGGRWTATAVAQTDGTEDLTDRGVHLTPGGDLSLVVTMTDHAASIAGRLGDALGRPAPEYEIVVFPADQAQRTIMRRIEAVQPALDGHYVVGGLPAGNYLVAAVTEVDPGDLHDPAFFDLIAPTSTRVSLADGEAHQLDLRIVGRR
jgi:hypothetical protein